MATKTKTKTLYDRARDQARKEGVRGISRRSREWFRTSLEKMGSRYTPNQTMNMNRRNNEHMPQLGRMYFYLYDPKLKDKLPYYDTFPLTIVIKQYKDGFLGLNLHYLPPKVRGIFLSKLMDIATDPKLDENKKFKITYSYLAATARYREFQPCLHRYLYSQMKSPLSRVAPEDWMLAIFMPVARFKKARKARVWAESLMKL